MAFQDEGKLLTRDPPEAGTDSAGPKSTESSVYPALGLAIVAGITVIAFLWPPVLFHLSGSDASNYANAAEQYAYGRHAGGNLLPPEISDPDVRSSISSRVLGDERGMLTPYVFVGAESTFSFAHRHLTPRVSALFKAIGPDSWVGYLNFAFLGLAAFLMGKFVLQLGYSRAAGILAGGLFLLVPSHIELARYPMSEPLATALILAALVLASNPRTARSAIPALPLLALPHTRAEGMLVVLLAVVVLAAGRPRGWTPMVAALIASSWLQMNDTSLHAGFGALSVSWLPQQISWPTPSALLNLIAQPNKVPSVIIPVAVLAAIGGMWPGLRSRVRQTIRAAGRITAAHPWVPVVALSATVVAGDYYKSTLEPGEVVLGVLRPSLYQTGWLIWDSAGPLLVLAGLLGLVLAIPVLIDRLGAIGWVVIIPLLGVLVSLHASPENELFWTRRLHLLVYPALILGAAALFAWTVPHLSLKRSPARRAAGAALAAVLLATHVAATSARFPAMRDRYLNAELMEAMHEGLGNVPPGSIVLLHNDPWGQKVLTPARTFHGLYSYVVWDTSDLDELLAAFEPYDRPVFVDEPLAAQAALDTKPDGAISVPVMESPTRGRRLTLQKVPPAPPDRDPGSRPRASGAYRPRISGR